MRLKIFIILLIMLLWQTASANNLQISNISPSPSSIQFDISWDNSWYTNSAPNNWDAVWVFIKVQNCGTLNNDWSHAKVSTNSSNHLANGSLSIDAVADGMGVFVRRASFGSGNISSTTVTLSLQDTYNLLHVNFKVMGIEMVAVLEGAFEVGGSGYYGFGNDGVTLQPFTVTSEGRIGQGALRHENADVTWTAYNPTIPASFPKGYNKFYMMKYEITQEQYVAFLNSLNYTQQTERTARDPNSAVNYNALADHKSNIKSRNGVRIQTLGSPTTPAVYGCNLNANSTFNEAEDGHNIACNFLKWTDLLAYLDWAALRPMTELEYEKAARGISAAVSKEYAWGTTSITIASSSALSGGGTETELSTASLIPGSGLCAHDNSPGPLRVGFAATPTSNRVEAGASYWGIMELSGNVFEQTFSVGYENSNIAPFTGALGDGELSSTGDANQSGWSLNTIYTIVKGGHYELGKEYCEVSDRRTINKREYNTERKRYTGGRGVRQY